MTRDEEVNADLNRRADEGAAAYVAEQERLAQEMLEQKRIALEVAEAIEAAQSQVEPIQADSKMTTGTIIDFVNDGKDETARGTYVSFSEARTGANTHTIKFLEGCMPMKGESVGTRKLKLKKVVSEWKVDHETGVIIATYSGKSVRA